MFRCLARLVMLALLLLVAGVFLLCQFFVKNAGAGRIYSNVSAIPARTVGLVLGTSEHLGDGRGNPYFQNRIEAAAQLFKAGKVKFLLVSGDNRTANYDEPESMRKALIAKGVPSRFIAPDDAGLRTLDSIVRAKEVFSLDKFTIISQRDHDEQALLIAQHYGVDAIAFAAGDVSFRYAIRSHIHEWLARVKVIMDLYILHASPRHMGQKIALPIDGSH